MAGEKKKPKHLAVADEDSQVKECEKVVIPESQGLSFVCSEVMCRTSSLPHSITQGVTEKNRVRRRQINIDRKRR